MLCTEYLHRLSRQWHLCLSRFQGRSTSCPTSKFIRSWLGLLIRSDIDFPGHFDVLHWAWCCDRAILMRPPWNKLSLHFSRPSVGNPSLQRVLQPAVPTAALRVNRASSAKLHGHYPLDVRARPRRAFRIPYSFGWGKWLDILRRTDDIKLTSFRLIMSHLRRQ